MNNSLTVLKLSDGVFYLWDSQMDMIRAETLLFGTRGIRSKGKTLVIDIDILRYMNLAGLWNGQERLSNNH